MIIGKDASAARQGDIYIERVKALPEGLQLVARDGLGRVVLALGETHDHAHALSDPHVCGFRTAGSEHIDYIEVGGSGATLNHEHSDGTQADHGPLSLAPGVYRVLRQREYVAPDIDRWAGD
jgi:hypothetical protein